MPFCKARLKAVRFVAARAGYACSLAVLLLLFGSRALQNAVAEGDTRTISLHHIHTDEDITVTYKRDGRYDDAALEKLNWFLRDWRKAEQTKMDPHLIDLVWEVQREAGNKAPIWVVCGYRSPATNAMLRHRSAGVARFSQHMLGRAMDFYIPGVDLEHLREIGLRLARGGVGFYPTSGSPFVHMDTGNVRMWPRMTHEQLVRVFPDGKTVQIPTDGKPLQGYALALAEIQQRGNNPSENSVDAARNSGVDVGTMVASEDHHGINPFAKLLGLRKGEEDDDADSYAPAAAPAPAVTTRTKAKAVAVAAVERVKAAVTHVAAQTKLIHTNSFAVAAATPAAQKVAPPRQTDDRFASLSPNQVIFARGYWQSPQDGTTAAQPKSTRGVEVASADPNATGTVGPLPGASNDRVPPQLALAYAEQPDSPSHAIAVAARAAVDKAGEVIGENETTVAVKGINDQPKTSVQKAIQLAAAAVKVTERLDNPWLRAIILSPSVHRFLSTLAFGARDVTYLASLMVKPASSVMMTFSADPNRGLSQDHFSGSAIVFLSTITYPTRTASLQ
ncbi:MAG TPA: DUF882 domain-containing protein [Xanthobacteraceae bacterium]|nr:DUF882 domain-containing protein [Xanthobacteraceae bacterium]